MENCILAKRICILVFVLLLLPSVLSISPLSSSSSGNADSTVAGVLAPFPVNRIRNGPLPPQPLSTVYLIIAENDSWLTYLIESFTLDIPGCLAALGGSGLASFLIVLAIRLKRGETRYQKRRRRQGKPGPTVEKGAQTRMKKESGGSE